MIRKIAIGVLAAATAATLLLFILSFQTNLGSYGYFGGAASAVPGAAKQANWGGFGIYEGKMLLQYDAGAGLYEGVLTIPDSPPDPAIAKWLDRRSLAYRKHNPARHLGFCGARIRWVSTKTGQWSMDALLPLWMPIVLFGGLTALAIATGPLRRAWRRRHGLCESCTYNLTGNISGICPECGKQIRTSQAVSPPDTAIQ